MTRPVVGLVGVGAMGSWFAAHLLAAGFEVHVHDVAPGPVAEAVGRGARDAGSVAGVAAAADVVVLSLPSEAAAVEVVDQLVAAAPRPGWALVETSTLSLVAKERIRRAVEAGGGRAFDCPVSGTSGQAAERDVVVLASGPADEAHLVQPLLEAIARSVRWMGAYGQGALAKLLANLLVAVHTAAAAEVLVLAEALGGDRAVLLPALLDGAGASRMLEVRGPAMVAGDFASRASVELFRKDVALIRDLAASADAAVPLLEVAGGLFERAAELGLGDLDAAVLHRVYQDLLPPAPGAADGSEG